MQLYLVIVFILASATDDTEGDNPYYVPVSDEN